MPRPVPTASRRRVLYVSYDGALEPLGESQVVRYLERLADRHDVSLLSYEKPPDRADAERWWAMAERLRTAGVAWHSLPYHRRWSLASTAYDVARGLGLARRIVRERRVEVVHARSYVASVIAERLQRTSGTRFLFDMRGFWPDEKVDAGTWVQGSAVYRLAKRYERAFLRRADAVVSLTEAGADELARFPGLGGHRPDVTVIPTCADLDRYHPPPAPPPSPFTLGYVGNTSGWYRFEPVAAAFEAIRRARPEARLVVVNRDQHDHVWSVLGAAGVPPTSVDVVALDPSDVPDAIRRMHASAFFLTPSFSKQASAPTRLAELLGCGVPCLVRGGVGDAGRIVEADGVGVVVDDVDPATIEAAASRLVAVAADPAVRERCVASAHARFSLRAGVEAYDALYDRLGGVEP